ncbi:MAG: hypothetical protein R2881_09825 [Eubacteriales bacterium]
MTKAQTRVCEADAVEKRISFDDASQSPYTTIEAQTMRKGQRSRAMRADYPGYDQNRVRGIPRVISVFTTVVFLALVGSILIRYRNFTYLLREKPFFTPHFLYLAAGYVALILMFALLIRRTNCAKKRSPAAWAAAILLLALAPRLYLFARWFSPDAGGELYTVFSTGVSARVLVMIQIFVSACSAVVMYRIARRFDEKSAPAAGILLALYPADIVGALTPGGAQLSTVLALASLLLILLTFTSVRRVPAVLTAALSGLLLLLASRMTDSLRVIAAAYGLFWLIVFLSSFGCRREPARLLLIALAFVAVFFGLNAALPREGSERPSLSAFFTVRDESGIADKVPDWDAIRARFVSDGGPSRFDEDIARLWMQEDDAFDRIADAESLPEEETALLLAAKRLDFFFVAGVFLFSWIGALLRRRCGTGELLLLTLLVWMGAHLFMPFDADGRGLAMPLLALFAVYGFFAVIGAGHRRDDKPDPGCVTRLIDRTDCIPPAGEPEGTNHASRGGIDI